MRWARYRSLFLLALACLLLGLAELRLVELQLFRARAPEDSSIYRCFRLSEPGRRGDIRDARGGLLATSVREVDVRVWTSGIAEGCERDLADRLGELCGIDPAQTLARLAQPRRWLLLATGIRDPGVIADLRDLTRRPGLRSVVLETRWVREYPRGAMLAPLVGWVSFVDPPKLKVGAPRQEGETRGVAGIEQFCEEQLEPTPGHRLVQRDGLMREMVDPELEELPPEDGRAVELTIEPLAQLLAEQAVDAAVAEFEPDWAQIVVVDPRTCEVKALVQRPTPPEPRPRKRKAGEEQAAELALHRCLPLELTYVPGSSFKPFMLGRVLEQGVATPETMIDCENGFSYFGSRRIKDSHPQPTISATDVLVHSSNIGMAKLVLRLVPETARKGDPAFQPILDHLKRMGFGAPVCGWKGEAAGVLTPLKGMDRNFALASMSFGQQMGVTALQMAAACSACANGGRWRAPRFLRDGVPDEGRQVFEPGTAATLKGMLADVVERGGTRRWRPRGWSMGGKTGTAEDEAHAKTSVNSYWCFAPLNEPRFLVLAVLYDPKQGRFAADNVAKVAGGLMGGLLEGFEVPRDRPEESPDEVVVSRTVGEGR